LRQEFVAFVHGIIGIPHGALAEELRLAKIRVPTGTLYPSSHHVVVARHEVGVMGGHRRREHSKNFVANFGRAALVRIEAEDPLVPAFRDSAISQVAKTVEGELYDARAEALRDFDGAVGAAGIGHHDFVGPQHARDGIRDFFGLVKGKDIGRYLLHVASLLSRTAVQAITAGRDMQDGSRRCARRA
jgi:hypothetical protein